MTPEGVIKKQIMDWLRAQPRAYGWLIQVGKIPGRTNHSKGIADIIGVFRGRGLAIEVKAPKGKLTPEQATFLDMWTACGGISIVARSLEDVLSVLTEREI